MSNIGTIISFHVPYVAGETQSPDFPTTPGAFDTSLSGLGSGFVSKLLVGTGTGAPPPPLAGHNCVPSPVDTFTVQNEPRGLALDPTRQRLYVANFGSNSISVADTRNDNVLQTLSGIDSANGLAYDASHNLIWVTNYQTDQVTPIQANGDATGFSVLSPVATGAGPWGVAYDPLYDFIYVANSRGNSVTVISAASRTLVTTLTGSFNQPFHLTANSLTGKVYVSNFGSASVTVLNGTTISRVVSLYDSNQPYGIAVDETRNLVYVATVSPIGLLPWDLFGGCRINFWVGPPSIAALAPRAGLSRCGSLPSIPASAQAATVAICGRRLRRAMAAKPTRLYSFPKGGAVIFTSPGRSRWARNRARALP